MKTDTDKLVLGKFLNGRYKAVHVLRVGTFGDVYLTEDSWNNNSRCVVKHLKPKSWQPERSLLCKQQFANEVLILNQLGSHSQIPQLWDCFENDQGSYLVQELIVGTLLSETLAKNKASGNLWSEAQCLEFLDDVLGILEFVHRQGFVHGNLQPNKLIQQSDGRFVLIDFGAATPVEPTPVKARVIPIRPALAPIAIPAIGYLPAEQLSGQRCPSSDLYALGVIVIEALTGLNPLQLKADPDSGELNWQQQVSISKALAQMLHQMVRYQFKDRYQSVTAVRAELIRLSMRSEVCGVSSEECSDLIVPAEDQELEECLHKISASPDAVQMPIINLNNHDAALTKQEYARQIAIACLPKVPPLLSGMGAGMFSSNVVAISVGLYTLVHATPYNPGLALLEQASQQYKQGNFEGAIAIANKIPLESSAYQDALFAKRQWRQEWNLAASQFEAIETAFNEQRWQDVLDAARELPDLSYWQQQIAPFVVAAEPQLEIEAQRLLQEASERAAQKDFTGALTLIKQISPETPTGAEIKPKLFEYTQKQQIKAESSLQNAYQQAVEKDFIKALQYLAEIPQDTPAYEIAQVKMAEYSQKQAFNEQLALQAQLNERLPKEVIKPIRLAESNKISKQKRNLNPGSNLQEVGAKPVRSLAAKP
ncbi:MAG: protein kinase [Coleofasciculaceae cyanobacterium]